MSKVSINEIVKLQGCTRATAIKRLEGVGWTNGPKQAKLYEHSQIFQWRAQAGEDGVENISEAESRRLLNLERIEGERLDNETKRKERIPIADCEAVYTKVIDGVVGIIKGNRDKPLTEETINEILSCLRELGRELKSHG